MIVLYGSGFQIMGFISSLLPFSLLKIFEVWINHTSIKRTTCVLSINCLTHNQDYGRVAQEFCILLIMMRVYFEELLGVKIPI
jgi:hypothetical protein